MQKLGRPREFDPDETLSKIMALFWEHGYEATGLRDIIAATGMGKASLYTAFGNKQSMYLKSLAQYEVVAVNAAVKVIKDSSRAPTDRIHAFLSTPVDAVSDHVDRRGCFLCNAAADRAALDSETSALVRQGFEKMRRAIADTLGEAFPDLDPSTIAQRAQLVLTVYSGLRILSRSGMTADELAMSRDDTMAALSLLA